MQSDSKAFAYGILAVVFWSTVATAFKIALRQVSYIELLAYSSLFSCFVLFLSIVFSGKSRILFEINLRIIYKSVLIGFLNPFLYYLVLFKAYSMLPAQEALSLNYTWAIVLTFLSSKFQKKRIGLVSYISLLISFFGVLVIISKGRIVELKPSDPIGALLALSSAFIWGFSWILNVLSKTDDNLRMFLNFFFGAIFSFVYLSFSVSPSFPNLEALIPICYVGFFEMGITFLIWNKALKYSTNPARVNNLIYLSPLLSIVFIGIILKEHIEYSSIFGLLLILSGIAIQNLFARK
jgi:drug/metabolite transporter (DMT)-like permease